MLWSELLDTIIVKRTIKNAKIISGIYGCGCLSYLNVLLHDHLSKDCFNLTVKEDFLGRSKSEIDIEMWITWTLTEESPTSGMLQQNSNRWFVLGAEWELPSRLLVKMRKGLWLPLLSFLSPSLLPCLAEIPTKLHVLRHHEKHMLEIKLNEAHLISKIISIRDLIWAKHFSLKQSSLRAVSGPRRSDDGEMWNESLMSAPDRSVLITQGDEKQDLPISSSFSCGTWELFTLMMNSIHFFAPCDTFKVSRSNHQVVLLYGFT